MSRGHKQGRVSHRGDRGARPKGQAGAQTQGPRAGEGKERK